MDQKLNLADAQNRAPEIRSNRFELLFALGIVLFLLWHYRDTFHNPALFGDDYFNISRSLDLSFGAHLKGFLAPNNSYDNRPLGNALYRWLYRTCGVSPLPYIGVLFGLHLANAALSFLLASRLLKNRFLAVLCSLAWAMNYNLINNIYSASVIYDNLAYLWWTACLLFYLRFLEKNGALAYLCAFACFLLCTRSKEVGVMLPLSLLVYEVATLDRRVLTCLTEFVHAATRIWKRQWPFYVGAGIYVVFYVRGSSWGLNSHPYESYFMQVTYPAFLEGLKFYLGRIVFEHRFVQNSVTLYLVFGSIFLWAAFLRQRVLWWSTRNFVITLLPVIFFVNLRQPIYLYLPLFGLAVTLTGLAWSTLDAILRRGNRWGASLAYAALAALFFPYFQANSKAVEYIRKTFDKPRADANRMAASLKQWYPEVPAGAYFYFFGWPEDLPNPDLFIVSMPKLLYPNSNIESSYLIASAAQVLDREILTHDAKSYCFEFTDFRDRADRVQIGHDFKDRTPELRATKNADTEQWFREGIWTRTERLPSVRLEVSPAEIIAGKDTVVYRVFGMKAFAIEILCSIDGKGMRPAELHFDDLKSCQFFVGPSTRKGRYHFVAIRDSNLANPDSWVAVDVQLLVK